nr:tripartite motif-containing protein 45-like [Crassostrea gigas]
MADSSQKNIETDILTTTCPICFESFKTPRILPCLHTFCHNCLSSYILSTCKSKESPVGFPCPLCRCFVPAPSFSAEIAKWTEHIPINKIIHTLTEKGDKLCDACRRADEEIEASDWCESCSELLCDSCVKYHKRNAVSKNHELISIVTFKSESEGRRGLESAPVICHDHGKRVKYFCVDHEELCCTKCVCTKHRKCTQIDNIEDAAESLRKSEKLEILSQKLSQVEGTLMKAKSQGEDTITYIDDTSDKIREDSTTLRDKIVHHVDFLLENHLSDVTKNIKHHKDRVTTFVDGVSDRQQLLTQYLHALKSTDKKPPQVLIRDYIKIKSQVGDFESWGLSQMQVKLNSNVSEDLVRILELKKFSDTCMQTELQLVPLCGIDFSNASIKLVAELYDSEGDVTGGCFLENGDIVLAHQSSSRILQFNHFKLKKEISLNWKPIDIVSQSPTLLLISNHNNKFTEGCVKLFDLDSFDFKDDDFFGSRCVFSLAMSSGFLYAACSDFIVKCDSSQKIRS